MNISIIIVNYNTQELTLQCLKSIYEQTKNIEFEVIVIDNASSDGSCNAIKNRFPQVILIESQINLGFGRANNLAIECATGKYVFLLNSDTILLNNAIHLFYRYMEENNSDETIGAIGCLLLDINQNPTYSSGEFPTIWSELRYINKKITEKFFKKKYTNVLFAKNSYKNVDFITGADLFIPKSVIDKIGAFDPKFFMYYEETDLQKRMADNGYQRLIIEGPKIIHLEGGSIASNFKFSYSRFSLSQKSLHIYMQKHFKGFKYCIFKSFMIFIRLTIIFDRRFSFKEKFKAIKLIFSDIIR